MQQKMSWGVVAAMVGVLLVWALAPKVISYSSAAFIGGAGWATIGVFMRANGDKICEGKMVKWYVRSGKLMIATGGSFVTVAAASLFWR